MVSYFLSDIHLRPHNDPKTVALAEYLKKIASGATRDDANGGTHVFFLGDIFDFWMGGHEIWVDRYRPFVEALEELRKKNVNVYFFEGNHDIHIDPFFNKLGVKIFVEPQILEIHGLKVRIEHGDLFNPDDEGYLFLRRFLRSRPLRWAALTAPGWLTAWVADRGTRASHKRTSRSGRRPEVIEDIKRRSKEYVQKCAGETQFDLMIMGHTHVREDYKVLVRGRSVQFINLGSWFEPVPQVFILKDESQEYDKIDLKR